MATEDTVQLNEAHAPKEASIDAFGSILESVKSELVKLRRDHDSRCLLSPYLLTMPIYRQNMIFTTVWHGTMVWHDEQCIKSGMMQRLGTSA